MKSLRLILPALVLVSQLSCGAKDAVNKLTSAAACTTYCSNITQHCGAPNTFDNDLSSACSDTCKRFPVTGHDGDATGDTVQCRVYHSGGPAGSDAATHCPHAGTSGGNVCGSWCDVYCREALNNCTGANALYPDMTTCANACSPFAVTGKPGDTAGNTVQCRIYHLNAAATDPATHCAHGKATSDTCK